MPRARRPLAFFLLPLLLWLSFAACAVAAQAPATQGRLQAPERQPIALEGQWGFVWQQFVDPGWTTLPAQAFAPAPASWNDVTADGKPQGQDGWGSYVLQLDCPAGQSLAVQSMNQRTASRLFVNGALVAAQGEPGTTAETTRAAVNGRPAISREFACPLRLTLHVSNFDHRAGGFVRGLLAAPVDVLMERREWRAMYEAGLMTLYLIVGLASLAFYAGHRRERVPLVFGIFCLAMATYADMLGERVLLRVFSAETAWVAFTRIEYLAWMAAMAAFVVTLRCLFPKEIPRAHARVPLVALALAAASVFVLPPRIYSYVVVPGQLIALLVSIYLAAAIARVRRHHRQDALVLFAGMAAIVATQALDLLLIDATAPDRKFAPLGFALFMLAPALIIARRMSRGLNAEERARTLEENARLREHVERMSRHDLKTPLNSVIGVTRLLSDDATLAPHQRDLVGVLEGAGLRMLEMVNISLDLFKMETGSYRFQPVPVDVRAVATRVLSDLNPLALDRRVELRLQAPDAQPVWAQGDALLCYSIVANLVKNALEATPRGQTATVALLRGDPVRLVVHNPGVVPAEVKDRFFEKYVTWGKQGGTGLGTYSARLMARAQRGDLLMSTSAAEGTTLSMSLRAGEVPAQPPHGAASRHALVVDDDNVNRMVITRFLAGAGFVVEGAADGLAATEAMLRRWPELLVLDMEMPRMSGLETLRWVRAREAQVGHAQCRVVVLSGHDDDAAAAYALQSGADVFLRKPVTREQLLQAAQGVCDSMHHR